MEVPAKVKHTNVRSVSALTNTNRLVNRKLANIMDIRLLVYVYIRCASRAGVGKIGQGSTPNATARLSATQRITNPCPSFYGILGCNGGAKPGEGRSKSTANVS